MRLPQRLKQLSKSEIAAGVCVLAAALVVGTLMFRATAGPAGAETIQVEAQTQPQTPSEPAPVQVPATPGEARKSGGGGGGGGGGTWMTGDPAQLGAEFKRSVAHQFGDGSMGQAHMAMAGLGFQCAAGAGGKMSCEKSMQADNCTLTWSVRLQSRGANVSGAGGEGFSRNCN